MGSPKYVVKYMLNTLLCDTRPRGGESMRLIDESAFDTEEEALKYYRERRALNKYGAGTDAHVVCYPVFVEDYTPTHIPAHNCDACGEGFDDDTYAEVRGGTYCSKSCLNSSSSTDDEPHYDEEPYYED